jgi:AraC-like DNA-binding protein
MTDISASQLLGTSTLELRDVICRGECRHKSAAECSRSTHLVFPYRGVYVRHVGHSDTVAEANQVLFFNEGESYRVSHPVQGGDACLSLTMAEPLLREMAGKELLRSGASLGFNVQRLRIDPRAQALAALLRHSLRRKMAETLEAETLILTLVRLTLGERNGRHQVGPLQAGPPLAGPRQAAHGPRASRGRQKLVDRAKLVISSELSRRWTLAEIAAEVGGSPVYLTQVFQQVEGVPLYRYQVRLRLTRALDLLDQFDDLSSLGLQLGFSSHSHFSAAFRQAYGRTPAEFRRTVRGNHSRPYARRHVYSSTAVRNLPSQWAFDQGEVE